jgi:hypothetical protein
MLIEPLNQELEVNPIQSSINQVDEDICFLS